MTNLVWFRNDLRVSDNPALSKAFENGGAVAAIYILEKQGGAANWWLHHSLIDLRKSLQEIGVCLILKSGDPKKIIPNLANKIKAKSVFWNRKYDENSINRDSEIKTNLREMGLNVESFKANLLFEPWEIKNGSQESYKIFTAFWRKCLEHQNSIPNSLHTPQKIEFVDFSYESEILEDWQLTPKWSEKFSGIWKIGEKCAQEQLYHFLENDVIDEYAVGRDFLAQEKTSKLSPYLAFGQISPKQIWNVVKNHSERSLKGNFGKFLQEIGWREFSYHLLFHQPNLPNQPIRKEFTHFPWRHSKEDLQKWQKGLTGFPVIDAAMREIWQTGHMHNRARMIVASFLTKDLLLPWQEGANWFLDCLFDADLASNSSNWQWVSGCGTDAAPYFRIFNPILQSKKFDPNGDYIRKWVPELGNLPNENIHDPSEAPEHILKKANVTLDQTYPHPMIDRKLTRERALQAYNKIRTHDK